MSSAINLSVKDKIYLIYKWFALDFCQNIKDLIEIKILHLL